jgi:hypothetical protein
MTIGSYGASALRLPVTTIVPDVYAEHLALTVARPATGWMKIPVDVVVA